MALYRLTHPDTDKYYIGSTQDHLEDRLKFHTIRARSKCNSSPMYRHFNQLDWNKVEIHMELDPYEVLTDEELLLLEDEHLKEFLNIDPNCLNKNRPIILPNERAEWTPIRNHNWYMKHREQHLAKSHECRQRWRAENPELAKQRDREQYEKHKEKTLQHLKEKRQGEQGDDLRTKQREYEKSRREATKQTCEICGGTYDCKTKKGHFKSVKHQRAAGVAEEDLDTSIKDKNKANYAKGKSEEQLAKARERAAKRREEKGEEINKKRRENGMTEEQKEKKREYDKQYRESKTEEQKEKKREYNKQYRESKKLVSLEDI